MGKILDTITVLFEGDTSDLEAKKKLAEQLAQEAADNIKNTKTATEEVKATLDATNKTLAQTDTLTGDVGFGLSAWAVAATQAAEALNTAFAAAKAKREEDKAAREQAKATREQEKATREQERTAKAIGTTKKGTNALEGALKGVVKQFAAIALAEISISALAGGFKDVVSGTLDLARTSQNLHLPIRVLDAYGQAAKNAGGSIQDVITSFNNLTAKYPGLTGTKALEIFKSQLKHINETKNEAAQQAAALIAQTQFGFTPALTTAAKKPGFSKNVQDVYNLNSNLDETEIKITKLNEAWNKFGDNIRSSAIDLENIVVGPLTRILNVLNEAYASKAPDVALEQHLAANLRRPDKILMEGYKAIANAPLNTYGYRSTGAQRNITVSIEAINLNGSNVTDAQSFSQNAGTALQKEIKNLLSFNDNSIVA